MKDRRVPAWPLLASAVGLGLTSWTIALEAVVTLPAAVLSGGLAAIGLFPPKGGVFLRHYAASVGALSIAVLLTIVWQRAWS